MTNNVKEIERQSDEFELAYRNLKMPKKEVEVTEEQSKQMFIGHLYRRVDSLIEKISDSFGTIAEEKAVDLFALKTDASVLRSKLEEENKGNKFIENLVLIEVAQPE